MSLPANIETNDPSSIIPNLSVEYHAHSFNNARFQPCIETASPGFVSYSNLPPSPPPEEHWSPLTQSRSLAHCSSQEEIASSLAQTAVSGFYPHNASPSKRGFLIKQGGYWKTWKKRYFVLQDKNLFYFKSEEDAKKEGVLPLGVIPLTSFFTLSKCKTMTKDEYCNMLFSGIIRKKSFHMFKIETYQRLWFLCAENEEEQLDWIRVLQEVERSNKRASIESPVVHVEDDVLVSGWLEKHTKGIVKRRWCVLKGESMFLYKAPGDAVPKSVLLLKPSDVTLEVVSPQEEDSDTDDSDDRMIKKDYHRFALQFKDGSCHWFRCDYETDLEIWIHSLLSVIKLTPSCATVSESLIQNIVDEIFCNQEMFQLDDEKVMESIDKLRLKQSSLRFDPEFHIQKDLPLTTLPTKRLIVESVNIAKAIVLFASTPVQQEGIEYHMNLIQALVQCCLEFPPLQNEFLLQLAKQTTSNNLQLWQLFALALGIFSPVREIYHYIALHLIRTYQKHVSDLVGEYAFYCLRLLMRLPEGEPLPRSLARKLPEHVTVFAKHRSSPPSSQEILNVLSTDLPPGPMRIIVDCKNDDMLSVPFEPFTTVKEFIKSIKCALDIGGDNSPLPSDEFRLFRRIPDQSGSLADAELEILKDDVFIGDVMFSVDKQMKKLNPSKQFWWQDEGNSSFLCFKMRFFLPFLTLPNENIVALILHKCNENEKRFVVNYAVETVSFRKFDYEDLLNITAYYAQIQWGDHYPLIQNRGLVHSQIKYLLELFHKDYQPKTKLDSQPGQVFQVITQTDSLLGEISNKWMCLRGKSAESSMDGFLKLTIGAIAKYSFKVYVECCGQDMGELCKMEISTSGLKISLFGKPIVKCGYDKVVYYVVGDEKSLVFGIHTQAIDEKIVGKKYASTDSTKLMILLAEEHVYSKDFLHIFCHFCELACK